MMKKLLIAVFMLLLSAPFSIGSAIAGEVKGVILDEPSPIKEFALKDQNGAPFTVSSLKGNWSLIFLGFTHCPDVCPFTLSNLDAVRTELATKVSPAKIPKIIFLAVDPERDEELLKDYVKHYGLNFTGITGKRAEIDNLVTSLDGFYRLEKKNKEDEAYNVTHSAAIAFVSPQGDIVAKISPPMQPFHTANYLFNLMHKYKTN